MSDRLAEIEARADAATPGPWEADLDRHGETRGIWPTTPGGEQIIGSYVAADGFDSVGWSGGTDDNLRFIAHARDDIPWLINRVRELEAQNSRLAGIPGIRTLRVHEEVAASITEAYIGWYVPHVGGLVEIADVAEHPGRVVLHIEGEGWADELVFHLGDPVLLVDPGEVPHD